MVPLPWRRQTSPPHDHMTGLLLLLLLMMMTTTTTMMTMMTRMTMMRMMMMMTMTMMMMMTTTTTTMMTMRMMMMMMMMIIIIITNIFCIIIDIHHHHHDDECYYCCDSFKLLSEESPIMIQSDVAVPSLPAFETYRGPSAMIPPNTCCKPSFISFLWHTSTCPLCSGWLRLTYFNWNLWKESQTCTILQCSLGKLLINHVFFLGQFPMSTQKIIPIIPVAPQRLNASQSKSWNLGALWRHLVIGSLEDLEKSGITPVDVVDIS